MECFRFLERQALIGEFVTYATGQPSHGAHHVVYWSYCQRSKAGWPSLREASARFGEARNRGSEPDLIIEADDALVFVEAKLGASNNTRPSKNGGPKAYATAGDGWYWQVFRRGSEFEVVAVRERMYELLRLWVMGTWIANRSAKRFYLVNLVRADAERDIEQRFRKHIIEADERKFVRQTWECIYRDMILSHADLPPADKVAAFMRSETLGYGSDGLLRRAFIL